MLNIGHSLGVSSRYQLSLDRLLLSLYRINAPYRTSLSSTKLVAIVTISSGLASEASPKS